MNKTQKRFSSPFLKFCHSLLCFSVIYMTLSNYIYSDEEKITNLKIIATELWNKKYLLKIKVEDIIIPSEDEINEDKDTDKKSQPHSKPQSQSLKTYFLIITPPLPQRIDESNDAQFRSKRKLKAWLRRDCKQYEKKCVWNLYFSPKFLN